MVIEVEAATRSERRFSHIHSVHVAVQTLNEVILYGAAEVPLTPESGLSSPYAAHYIVPANIDHLL